jgi:2-methylcitrate dehydratase PrpD
MTVLQRMARWACNLTLDDVPPRVREQAVNQWLSTLAAIYTGYDSDLGPRIAEAFPAPGPGAARISPTGESAPPAHAAMLMAAWSMVLDFDDVMLGGHTGHSSVIVPLALAAGRSGSELLVAQIVANEIAARINMVCAVGSTRGQMATHLHLIAAAAARAKLEGLNETRFAEALAFAMSYPGHALYPAFLGSDAKVLCAALPVRTGMEAVDAVRAGLRAPHDPLDDPRGFFARAARIPVRDFLDGLGEQWHTETNSYKLYPVCGYLCAALDATLDLVRDHNLVPRDIAAVDVFASIFTVGMDAHSAPYLDGPGSHLSTLTFSTPFVIASAIVARDFTPARLKRDSIATPSVWGLASRVRVRHDLALTLDALTADIPIGAALRRIPRWKAALFALTLAGTARLRNPLHILRLVAGLARAAGERGPLDLRHSTKPMGARVEMRLTDGRVVSRAVSMPRGFAGGGDDIRALMRGKLAAAVGNYEATQLLALLERLPFLSRPEVAQFLTLLTLPARPTVVSRAAVSWPPPR